MSWARMSIASTPPMRKKTSTVPRYMRPIFLWSVVVNHDVQPVCSGSTLEAMICGRGLARRAGVAVSVRAAKSFLGCRGLLDAAAAARALGQLLVEGAALLGGGLEGLLDLLPLAREPLLVVVHAHADDARGHVRVVAPAQLGALAGVDDLRLAGLDGVGWDAEPGAVDVARDGVHLAAQLRDPVRVGHV